MPKGIGYGHKKKKKDMTLSREEHATAQLGGGKDSYKKYLARQKKKKNSSKMGRIFEGPRGGQWTPRKKKE